MNKSATPIIIGILYIAQAILYGILPVVALIMLERQPFDLGMTSAVGHAFIVIASFVIVGIPVGILTMVGGIFALKRRKWGLALAASIAVFLPSIMFLGILSWQMKDAFYYTGYSLADYRLLVPFIVAILALVLTVTSRKQFVTKTNSQEEGHCNTT